MEQDQSTNCIVDRRLGFNVSLSTMYGDLTYSLINNSIARIDNLSRYTGNGDVFLDAVSYLRMLDLLYARSPASGESGRDLSIVTLFVLDNLDGWESFICTVMLPLMQQQLVSKPGSHFNASFCQESYIVCSPPGALHAVFAFCAITIFVYYLGIFTSSRTPKISIFADVICNLLDHPRQISELVAWGSTPISPMQRVPGVRLRAAETSDDSEYGSCDTSHMNRLPFRKDTVIQTPAFPCGLGFNVNDLVLCGGYFLATLTFGFKWWIDKRNIREATCDALLFAFFLIFFTRKTLPHQNSIRKSVLYCSRYYRNLFFGKVYQKYKSWGFGEVDWWRFVCAGASFGAGNARRGNCVLGSIRATNHRSIVGRRRADGGNLLIVPESK